MIQANISSLSSEYGATAQIITQELAQELDKIKRQKSLGIGRLAEAIFLNIRARHTTVRDSYIAKNLNKLVSFLRVEPSSFVLTQVLMSINANHLYITRFITKFCSFLQAPEDKFNLKQTEVTAPGLFSNTEAFKKAVGATKTSAQDKWAESAAVLSKLVAATTKTAQKAAPKKQQQPKG